ncbi:hypothetical protein P3T36_007284 [Kitasatospora sp. MAP12-15]|uniref:hypothetical protein n=1 Tax=unclassified Kitasatospora TaxID=2633591 RepID=UPI0024767184|nr:hypothetical protein [Kitasatospora sp. MAP12-44]MDH6115667.1 hypothetical protein [Kitasatospora sp. MAP12-44]
MSAGAAPVDVEPELIGRCYTKARSSPLVVGVVRGGDGRNLRLIGGPYTITQLGAMVATVVLLVLSRPVWGGHGLADAVVLVGAPFGSAFALRHLHIDGRNPLAAAASVLAMLAAPGAGRLHGRPVRPARPVRCHALVGIGTTPARSSTTAETTEVPIRAVAGGTVQVGQAPGSAAPRAEARPAAPAGAPVASGVQALLARRTTHLGD